MARTDPQSEVAEPVTAAVAELAISTASMHDDDDQQVVTPSEVAATANGAKYAKLVDEFGLQQIDAALIERIQRLTSTRPAHRFLRRGIFSFHRDLNQILDLYERGEKFYLYTGRGPSSESLHIGHLVPFMFTKYLQDVFKVPVVIGLTDDEKFLRDDDLSIPESTRFARENVKDIIACGFDIEKTFIFTDFNFVRGAFYENIMEVAKRVKLSAVAATFGFKQEDSIGKVFFPIVQAVSSFASSFPSLFGDNAQLRCLIPCGTEQDSYFRMTRDVAPKIGYHKPSLIESEFLPALQGVSDKMSASEPSTAVYLTDTREVIEEKIKKHAFSGGQSTAALQKKYGANLDTDVSIKYLNFFLEDDAEFENIKKEYKAGNMLTGKVKAKVIDVLSEIAEAHQNARAGVTEEIVDEYMSEKRPRPNLFG